MFHLKMAHLRTGTFHHRFWFARICHSESELKFATLLFNVDFVKNPLDWSSLQRLIT